MTPEPPARRRQPGTGLVVAGLVTLLLVTPLILVVTGIAAWQSTQQIDLVEESVVPGQGVNLPESTDVTVSVTVREDAPAPSRLTTCRVTGPADQLSFRVDSGQTSLPRTTSTSATGGTSGPGGSSNGPSTRRMTLGTFTTQSAGEHRISCGDYGAVHLSGAHGLATGLLAVVGSVTVGTTLAALTGFLGFVLTVVGTVLLAAPSRRSARPGEVRYR